MRFGAAIVVACIAHASIARAEPSPEQRAHAAYDRGVAAYDRKDFATAAREFAEADATFPNPTALQAALDAAVLADDPALGAELLERSKRTKATGALADSVRAAEKRFARRAGRIRIVCSAEPCSAAVDGVAADPRAPVFVRVGSHAVTIQVGEKSVQRVVNVLPDRIVDASDAVAAPAPAPAPTPAPASTPAPAPASGLSPVFVYAGGALTIALGALTAISGIDTSSKHDTFAQKGCATGSGDAACAQAASDGKSAQTRTNVLLGATAIVGAATAIVAVTLVRWRTESASVALVNGAPSFVVRGSF